MLVVLLEDFHISRMEGAFLLLCIVFYVTGNIMTVKRTSPEEDKIEGMEIPEDSGKTLWRDVGFLILGIVTLGFGANFLVTRPCENFRTERSPDWTDHCLHRNWNSGIGHRPDGRIPEDPGPCHWKRSRL